MSEITLQRIISMESEATETDGGQYILTDSDSGTKKMNVGALMANDAPAFSSSTAYSAGDIVVYNTKLYKFSADHSAGAWVGTDAEQITLGAEVSGLKRNYTNLSGDVSDIEEALETKAEIDGNYETMTVGNANQLLSDDYLIDKEPYQFRTTGGANDVGDREYDTLVGGTVGWNQMVVSARVSTTVYDLTLTRSDDAHALTISGTASTSGNVSVMYGTLTRITNHVYIGSIGTPSVTGAVLNLNGVDAQVGSSARLFKATTDGNIGFNIHVIEGTEISMTVIPQLFDLTQMFGTTIADYIYSLETATDGAGVALFRSLFPLDYYPYDAGSLKSVEGVSAHVTTGFNQWDEEWEVGSITSDGNNYASTSRIRSKGFCPVVSGVEYYCKSPQICDIHFYDSNYAHISYVQRSNTTFTVPDRAKYFRFCEAVAYGTTYNHDICINLSWSGYRNGEYEPYVKHSYPLDSTLTLRGIPKLDASNHIYYDGDTYESDGTVNRRYGIVDLGTLTWTYNDTYTDFSTPVVSGMAQPSATNAPNAITGKYVGIVYERPTTADKVFMIGRAGVNYIRIRDTSYTDAQTFKTAMSGVYLVYELAEPSTETADPFASPQICDDFGTEEYITTSIIPVGHDTKYIPNLRDKLRHLPAPTGTNGNYIIKETGEKLSLIPLPAEVPTPPTEDGTYVLKATISSGVATLTWVSE